MRGDPTFGRLVNAAARTLRRLADRRLEPLGLSSGYLPVLGALMAEGELSQKALVERAGIEQPTMVATLSRMERDGVIERRIDPNDRRSSRIALSKTTLANADAIRAAIASLNEEVLSSLDAADRATLRELLLKVIRSGEQALEG